MQLIAVMATFPSRQNSLMQALLSLSNQVDRIHLILNEYKEVPGWLSSFDNVTPFIPEFDLKDTGKFYKSHDNNDIVLTCDDDIIYPSDYSSNMTQRLIRYKNVNAIVGVHGIIYSDFFSGKPNERIVYVFNRALKADTLVNQLGTGTVAAYGHQMPDFQFMKTSQRFVDLRFAVYALRKKHNLICVAREKDWMRQIDTGNSLFASFTSKWKSAITREAQEIAGFSKLSPNAIRQVAMINDRST